MFLFGRFGLLYYKYQIQTIQFWLCARVSMKSTNDPNVTHNIIQYFIIVFAYDDDVKQ